MHPTADTPLVKYLQKRGAAGDAWRYAAVEIVQRRKGFSVSTFTQYLKKHFLLVTFLSAILLVLVWYGVKVGVALHVVNETFNVNLAEDAKTREYLGEVVSEVKDPQTDKVVGYRIRQNSGGVIERRAESVRVFEP
jgi:hypothetical protein